MSGPSRHPCDCRPRYPASQVLAPWRGLFGVLLLIVLLVGEHAAAGAPPNSAGSDPLGLLLQRELTGTSAGYVDDAACAICHPATAASYQGVGMAQSLRRPAAASRLEDDAHASYEHLPSQQHFTLQWQGDALRFRRWQLDARGRRINEVEQNVDWILGSGHRSRVYLYRTPGGELYQLPVAWYAQEGRLGMAPGYDRADHDGLTRRIRRECLFCHNAYPEQDTGSDARWAPQTFPSTLPQGTGCQRCHGPGASHARTVVSNGTTQEIRDSIVNPRRLAPARRDDICFQCHLLPAVAVIGPRRFGHGDYSFRPGQALDDYLLHVEVSEANAPPTPFEINHHAWRLTQSPCYTKGGITCIDCHDPHQPLASDPRLKQADMVCQRCHQAHSVSAPADSQSSCTTCHMPRRRTQDVVHVSMTDHRIQRPPAGDLLATLHEREPEVSDVRLLHAEATSNAGEADVYRTIAIVRAGLGAGDGVTHLQQVLQHQPPAQSEPWYDLVAAQLGQRRFADALATTRSLMTTAPDDPLLLSWLGTALAGTGKADEALAQYRRAAAIAKDSPEVSFNLGLTLHGLKRDSEAVAPLTHALTLRPNFVAAWIARAAVHAALGSRTAAIADYQHALTLQPRETRVYLALAPLLDAAGKPEEALRYLQLGARVAARPEAVQAFLVERAQRPANTP